MSSLTGFIKNYSGQTILPITRAELVRDKDGYVAFRSPEFAAEACDDKGIGGQYGLMSPEEKAMLNGGTDQNLSDIYDKVNRLSTHFMVEDTILELLTKPLIFSDSTEITPTVKEDADGYKLEFNIVSTLANKYFDNSYVTSSITDGTHITNKNYVDNAIKDACDDIKVVATGALKFSGVMTSRSELDKLNSYDEGNYFLLGELSDGWGTLNDKPIKVGDTLIVVGTGNNKKWEIVPSGNEIETRLHTDDSGSMPLLGEINLTGSGPITTTVGQGTDGKRTNTIYINMPAASTSSSGYLTYDDYNRFNTAANKEIKYTNLVSDGLAIGTFNTNNVIIPKLVANTTSGQAYIQYSEFETTPTSGHAIKLTGSGINITSPNASELLFTPAIHEDSRQYLSIDGHALKLDVWTENHASDDALITFNHLAKAIGNNVLYDIVSFKGEDGKPLASDPLVGDGRLIY